MGPALWWGLLAVVMFTLEVATASFFFLWIGAGAVLTAVASFWLGPDWAQYACFALSSILLVAVSRRWAAKISGKSSRLANVDSLVGQEGRVTQVLSPAKVYATVEGESWLVEALDGRPLALGDLVSVREVRSNRLMVETRKPA
ncbi:MAG TPA: NfeD family protein [bacterium]|nr:NfeD family protein [bacterium]